DRVFLRRLSGGSWSAAEEVSPSPGDFFRCSLAIDGQGGLHAFWAGREGTKWDIWERVWRNGSWGRTTRVSAEGSNTFHRAASAGNGDVLVVWQSFRGSNSDIWGRRFRNGS